MSEPAKVFEDRLTPGRWRVEWFDDDRRCECRSFAGPKARKRAIGYADRQFGLFEESGLSARVQMRQAGSTGRALAVGGAPLARLSLRGRPRLTRRKRNAGAVR